MRPDCDKQSSHGGYRLFLSTLSTLLSTLDTHYQLPLLPPGEVHMDDNSMQYDPIRVERGDTSGSFSAPAWSDAPYVNPPMDSATDAPPSMELSDSASPIDWDAINAFMTFEHPPHDVASTDHDHPAPAQLPASLPDMNNSVAALLRQFQQSTRNVDATPREQQESVNPADLQKIPTSVARENPFDAAQQQSDASGIEQMQSENPQAHQTFTNADAHARGYSASVQQSNDFVNSQQQSQYQPVNSQPGYPVPLPNQQMYPSGHSQMQGYPTFANPFNHPVDSQPVYDSQHQGHFAPHPQQIFPSAFQQDPNAEPSGGMNSFPAGPSDHSFHNDNEYMGVMQHQAMNAEARSKLQPRPQYTPFGQLPQSQTTFLEHPDQAIFSIPNDHDAHIQPQSKPRPQTCGRKRYGIGPDKLFSKSQGREDNFVICTVAPPIASTSAQSAQGSDGGRLKRPRSPDPESEVRKVKKIKLSTGQYEAVKRMAELTPERPSMSLCEMKTIRSSMSISDKNFFLKLPLEERRKIEEELGKKWVDHEEDLTDQDVVWLTSLTLVTDEALEKIHEQYPGVDPEYFFAISEIPEGFLCPYCPEDRPVVLTSLAEVTPHGNEMHAISEDSSWRTIVNKGVVKKVSNIQFQKGIRRKVSKTYCPYCWEQMCGLEIVGRHFLRCKKFERLLRDGTLELEQYDDGEGEMINEVDERYWDEYVREECREESSKTELPFLSDLLAKHGLC